MTTKSRARRPIVSLPGGLLILKGPAAAGGVRMQEF